MYKTFRKTVEKIIKTYTGEDSSVFLEKDNRLKIQKKAYQDFIISKEGSFLYIGYYREMNGDLISDPIFVFQIKNNIWYPIALEQVLGYSQIGFFENNQYIYYPSTNKDVRSFSVLAAKEWDCYYLKNKTDAHVVA